MNSGNCPPLTLVLSSAPPDGVESWAALVRQQQATIQAQQGTIQAQQEAIEALER
jgi:hypothetical protein